MDRNRWGLTLNNWTRQAGLAATGFTNATATAQHPAKPSDALGVRIRTSRRADPTAAAVARTEARVTAARDYINQAGEDLANVAYQIPMPSPAPPPPGHPHNIMACAYIHTQAELVHDRVVTLWQNNQIDGDRCDWLHGLYAAQIDSLNLAVNLLRTWLPADTRTQRRLIDCRSCGDLVQKYRGKELCNRCHAAERRTA